MDLLKPLWLISQNAFFIITGIAGIGFLIGFHELGHFLFCKLFKIRTPSFSIGFGPKIISKKIGDTEFSLSAIPLGGYVEIAGALEVGQGDQKEASRDDQYSFAIKPYYQKLLVMIGGIFFNLLFAYVTLIILCMAGLPKSPLLYPKNAQPVIESIALDSAAQKYGLQKGDNIRAINDISIHDNVQKLIEIIQKNPNKLITLTIERNNTSMTLKMVPDERQTPISEKPTGSLGVVFEMIAIPGYSFIEAIKQGIMLANNYVIRTIQGYRTLFTRRNVGAMAGPLMIISLTSKGAAAGIKVFLIFLSIISINLAILNLLPLPIFDGGQILFYSIEALIRRPLPNYIREYIHIASWIAVLLLIAYLSVKDIARIASPYIESIVRFLGFGS